ncbi:urease accessory protein UreD [Paraflavisolibacter sp. H34]|uniref:urease accessory protein UreD n=1 Tax=Huijunlia imazamoxiresistens TaxID=3127457 RepID=UPI0030180AA6
MISELSLQTALRNGRTYLKDVYCTPPFKVADITEDRRQGVLHLMIMSSSPGVLDGDRQQVTIDLAEGTQLHLHTQAYQRLFHMKKGATQQVEVRLGAGASLCYLPLPVVPHVASHFTARNRVHLSSGCRLVWGEVLTCGRKLSGEVFRFTHYQNITEVFLAGRLVLKENLLLRPDATDLSGLGQWEGYTHQGGLIFLDETASVSEGIAEISEDLSAVPGISFGLTAAPVNGLILRLLGHKAETLHSLLKKVADKLLTQELRNKGTQERTRKLVNP